jgi:uroporphyrinogen-III synthase
MNVLITRPIEDAKRLTKQLHEKNIQTFIEPLISISYNHKKDINIRQYKALIFTSSNAVRAFASQYTERDIQIFVVGHKTAYIARTFDFKAIKSANGDVEKLSGVVINDLKPRDGPLLYLCGEHISGNIETILKNNNFQVDKIVNYKAIAATHFSNELCQLIKNNEIDYIPFYSSRTAHIFNELVKKANLNNYLMNIIALCLSPAINNVLQSDVWRTVLTAEKQTEQDLFKLINVELEDPSS